MATTALWVLMNVALVADWGQTRHIAKNPTLYYEQANPVIQGHPTVGQVDAWFIGSLVVNNGIMLILPKKYRPYYAGVVTAMEAHFIISNNQIGIKISF